MGDEMHEAQNRWLKRGTVRGDDYDRQYERAAAAGENVHGEADFVQLYSPKSVLDAGCGTGRVGIELSRRGVEVVGVDVDPAMLATARKKGPDLEWHEEDLATVRLNRRFDAIVLAGNVMIFLAPGSEEAVVRNLARHLAPGGAIIAGFQLSMGYMDIDEYDRLARLAGLRCSERYSTWQRDPFYGHSTYAVSVHRHRTFR